MYNQWFHPVIRNIECWILWIFYFIIMSLRLMNIENYTRKIFSRVEICSGVRCEGAGGTEVRWKDKKALAHLEIQTNVTKPGLCVKSMDIVTHYCSQWHDNEMINSYSHHLKFWITRCNHSLFILGFADFKQPSNSDSEILRMLLNLRRWQKHYDQSTVIQFFPLIYNHNFLQCFVMEHYRNK